MGFMSQFNSNSSRSNRSSSNLLGTLSAARQLAGNDPRSFLQTLADNGTTVNLPNGKSMAVSELMQMADGKSAQELVSQLGLG